MGSEIYDAKAYMARMKAQQKYLSEERQPHINSFLEGTFDGPGLTRELSRVADAYVIEALEGNLAGFEDQVSVLALGANGRDETCIHSDLDILLLVPPGALDPKLEQALENLFYALPERDIPLIRSVDQCLNKVERKHHEVHTSLLDRRHLWGSTKLFEQLDETVNAFNKNNAEDYVLERLAYRRKTQEQKDKQFHNLEPDIKGGSGGLREIQSLLWIGKVLHGCETLSDLTEHVPLTKEDSGYLQKSYEYLLTVRCHLHDLDEKKDRFLSKYQKDTAQRMAPTINPDKFMQDHFKTTRNVGLIADLISAAFEEKIQKTSPKEEKDSGFIIAENKIRFDGELKDPLNMLNIYHFAQGRDLKLHHSAIQTIRKKLNLVDEAFRTSLEANTIFMQILTHKKNGGQTLREMQKIGLLQKFLPPFEEIDSWRQFNLYHTNMIDEHLFQCIEKLDELKNRPIEPDDPLAYSLSKTLSEQERRVLNTATLLHDICKRQGDNHSELGAKLAQEICPRLRLSIEETNEVAWLIANHVLLRHKVSRRDVEDTGTTETFSQKVSTISRINLLTILTAADTMGIKDKEDPLRCQLIKALYGKTKHYFGTGKLQEPSKLDLPEGYKAGKTYIDVTTNEDAQVNEITIVAPDRPGLFNDLVNILSEECNIMDVTVDTFKKDGKTIAFDRMTVHKNSSRHPFSEAGAKRLKKKIEDALNFVGPKKAEERKSKNLNIITHSPFSFTQAVKYSNEESSLCTIFEITSINKPGILKSLTGAFNDSEVDIRGVRSAYHGEKAINAFYICDNKGQKITDKKKLYNITNIITQNLKKHGSVKDIPVNMDTEITHMP